MAINNTYTVSLEKTYRCSKEAILNLFRDNALFTLTGADNIQSEFNTGGLFTLVFTNRGVISGKFTKITGNEIVLDWNVEGFQRPREVNTIVKIMLREENESCILSLIHKNIMHAGAAEAKRKAWTEILEEIEKHLNNG